MKPPSNNVDKYGFPIPPTFEDLHPAVPKPPRKPWAGKKLVGWVLGLAILTMIFWESGLRDAALLWPVEWNVRHAQENWLAGDLHKALRGYDNAIAWTEWPATAFLWKPDTRRHIRSELHLRRGRLRVEADQVQEGLDDFSIAIELNPSDCQAYEHRGMAYQRLQKHRLAINDMNTAVKVGPKSNARLLNDRAYVRAIAGMELEGALEDIERALELSGPSIPEYLDTRAFVRFQLGQLQPALDDMDKAIEQTEEQRDQRFNPRMQRRLARHVEPGLIALERRHYDHSLAVMYHHRGQIHDKLGNAEKAQDDLRRGDELGYNPAKGVY
jgi:tetratricopeptide (TPR) repeat protein